MVLKPSLPSAKSLLPLATLPAVRRQYKVRALFLTLLAVLVMWARYQQTLKISGTAKGPVGTANVAVLRSAKDALTLQFELCNGFTNQRISLLTGIVLAAATNRSVVLPEFLLNGMQPDDMQTVTADQADTVAFREWFDEGAFAHALAAHGVHVADAPTGNATALSLENYDSQSKPNALVGYIKKQRAHQHIRIACPAFRVPGALIRKHAALLHAAVEGLQPSDRFRAIIASRRQLVEAKAELAAYNLVHLRVEQDWFSLCKIWSSPEAGRDNCMNNTDTVGEQLQKHGFEEEVPVVVVTSFPDAVPEALATALQSIKLHKYTVVLGSELVQPGQQLTREESALVDYYLGLEAGKFTGNSVSTFTAFIILERQWLGRQSAHYNGGAIPLALFFPLYADDVPTEAEPSLADG